MKKSKFTESQIIDAIKRHDAGLSAADHARELGISAGTFYTWRKKYAGMEPSHLKRLNSQFIIATHSPVLMGLPGARLYEITADGMEATDYESTEHYRITKGFWN